MTASPTNPVCYHQLSKVFVRAGQVHSDAFAFTAGPVRIKSVNIPPKFELSSVDIAPHGSAEASTSFTREDVATGRLAEYVIVPSDNVRVHVKETGGSGRYFGGYISFESWEVVDESPVMPDSENVDGSADIPMSPGVALMHQHLIESPGEAHDVQQFLEQHHPTEETPAPVPRVCVNGNGNGNGHQVPRQVPQHQQSQMGHVVTQPAPGVPKPGEPFYENYLPKAAMPAGSHPYSAFIPGYGGQHVAGGSAGAPMTSAHQVAGRVEHAVIRHNQLIEVPPNCVAAVMSLADAQLLLRLASGDGGIPIQHLENAKNALRRALLGGAQA